MRNPEIEKKMYELAVELIEKRYPTGWGGAGVVHTAQGHYFTSVCLDNANASAVLCIETGAMLEAHKYNEKVTHLFLQHTFLLILLNKSFSLLLSFA